MNRRQFLQGSAAALLVPLMPTPDRKLGEIVGELSSGWSNEELGGYLCPPELRIGDFVAKLAGPVRISMTVSVYQRRDGEQWTRRTELINSKPTPRNSESSNITSG